MTGVAPRPESRPTRDGMKGRLKIALWRSLAVACIALAVVGALLPVLPTVPFLIVAAWAGGKGWPQLERWLLEHPRHGPAIRHWRDRRAVPRRAKWMATSMMAASAVVLAFSPVAPWVKVALPALMLAIAIWLWRHPDT
ncbi:MAG: YbaN family protein [Burkholderiales bacterium]